MREVNVAIADDNERILDMLGEIIEQDQDLNLIGKADNLSLIHISEPTRH